MVDPRCANGRLRNNSSRRHISMACALLKSVAKCMCLATGKSDRYAHRLCPRLQIRLPGNRAPDSHAQGRRMHQAVRGSGVRKLDRLPRSLKDLLTILERVSAAGAKFKSLTESIDTSGPAGRMLMQMLGSFAEFEREMIRERTRAGLHEARAQGRVPGRKPKITAEQKKEIVEAVSSGRKTPAEIARLLKIHRATVSRIVSQARVGV